MNMKSTQGVPVSYFHTWTRRQWGGEVEIFAQDAHIKLDMFGTKLEATVDGMTVSFGPEDDCMLTEDQVFVDCVAAKDAAPIRSTYSDSLESLALALAISRAAETGETQRLSG